MNELAMAAINQLIIAALSYARTRDPNFPIPTDAEIQALRDGLAAEQDIPETVEAPSALDSGKQLLLDAIEKAKAAIGYK